MSRLNALFFAIGPLFAVVPFAAALLVMPGFRDTFASFGAPLPALTRVLIEHPSVLLALPVAVLGIALAWPKKPQRGAVSLVVGASAGVLGVVALVVGAYLPIWQLGAAI